MTDLYQFQEDSLLSSSNEGDCSDRSSSPEASQSDQTSKAGEGLSSAAATVPHIVSSVSSVASPAVPSDDISQQGTTRQDDSQTRSTSGKFT